jgi:FkbM family methyltransferase
MTRSWWLDELAHAGPEHLDPAFVAGYNAKAGVDTTDDITPFIEHGVGPDATVIDFGAGTGRFAIRAAKHFRRVIAVEPSSAMLAMLRAEAPENVESVRAGFLSYAHDGPSADGVYTRNALHQLPDFWKVVALHRVADLLRPAGVLRLRDLVFDCEPSEIEPVIDRWMANAASDPARGYTANDFASHLRTEHSTMRWLLEPMLDHAGFDIVSVEYRVRVYGTYTCIRR